MGALLPILLLLGLGLLLAILLLTLGQLFGPRRTSSAKEMPYESGMDPIHDARRRFDVRFYLIAVAFLILDVELLFLYPWAVANKSPAGLAAVAGSVGAHGLSLSDLVFIEVMVFVGLLTIGFVYAWRKGVFRW